MPEKYLPEKQSEFSINHNKSSKTLLKSPPLPSDQGSFFEKGKHLKRVLRICAEKCAKMTVTTGGVIVFIAI